MERTVSVFSLALSLFLLLLPHQNTAIAVDLIHETCKSCAEMSPFLSYDFCVTSLQPIPQSHTSNLQELAVISLKLAMVNATGMIWSIQKLLKSEASDPYAMECLEDCLELYTDAIFTLEDSIGAFKYEDYISANIWISSAMEAATTCEGGFEEEGKVSPLTKQNYDFFRLGDIALVITHLVSSVLSFSSL